MRESVLLQIINSICGTSGVLRSGDVNKIAYLFLNNRKLYKLC